MSHKWRILCTVHGWQYGWSDSELTECPIEPSDPLVPDRVYIVGEEVPILRITPISTQINNTNYSRVASTIYDGDSWGPLYRVKVYSSMDLGVTSYDVELYNRDTHTSIITANFTNTGDVQECDLGLIPTPIYNIVNLEINMKRTGGGRNDYANIGQIVFFSRKEGW